MTRFLVPWRVHGARVSLFAGVRHEPRAELVGRVAVRGGRRLRVDANRQAWIGVPEAGLGGAHVDPGLHHGGGRDRSYPYDQIAALLDMGRAELERISDEDLLLAATAACVEPDGINTLGIELPVEELSLVASLSHPDWLTVALNAVRAGAGKRCDPGTIARWFDDDPDEGDLSEEDLEFLTAAFTINAPSGKPSASPTTRIASPSSASGSCRARSPASGATTSTRNGAHVLARFAYLQWVPDRQLGAHAKALRREVGASRSPGSASSDTGSRPSDLCARIRRSVYLKGVLLPGSPQFDRLCADDESRPHEGRLVWARTIVTIIAQCKLDATSYAIC